MQGGIYLGIDNPYLLYTTMLVLLLTDKHLGIRYQLLTIALRDFTFTVLPVYECVIFPFKQIVVELLGGSGCNFTRIGSGAAQ